ncbi:dienelactone hydrolase family protein [bacterium]|nr:dienelactone hydrolase family protein [bacterium]
MHTETVRYTVGEQTFEGYIAYDSNASTTMPGVVIFHQWMGLTDYEQRRAREVAELGYFVLAADLYGEGVRPANRDEAAQQAGQFYQNPALFQRNTTGSLDFLRSFDRVDDARVGAMGYCFGGTASLMLAGTGADVRGIVSFHGGLSPVTAEMADAMSFEVLVQHGADDPHVPKTDVDAFKQIMDDADVSYVFVEYANAVHAFTQPMAGNDPSQGAAYNKTADLYSWDFMVDFWARVFAD